MIGRVGLLVLLLMMAGCAAVTTAPDKQGKPTLKNSDGAIFDGGLTEKPDYH